jgi:adenylate cyclase
MDGMRGRTTVTRVNRCFAFLDLCAFTDFVDSHGDDAAVAELTILRATVREVAPLCGVRVDKWLGDGVMLVGVEAEPLVGAVVAIEHRFRAAHARLALRGGIAAGDVILLEGDDYVGRAVNLAARLADVAGPHQILAADDPHLELPAWVDAAPAGSLEVKGFAEVVPVASLAAARSPRTGALVLPGPWSSVIEGLLKPLRGKSRVSGDRGDELHGPA